MADLIPVSKGGKFLGYADKRQMDHNPKLKRWTGDRVVPVSEEVVQVEPPEEKVEPVKADNARGADPRDVKRK